MSMTIRYLLLFAFAGLAMVSCKKTNDMSKIPNVTLTAFISGNGSDKVLVNIDTAFLLFDFTDGDADIGTDPGSTSDIYIKDLRGGDFNGYSFPADIDRSIEDPKKGIKGSVVFQFTPDVLTMRDDSLHNATKRDTTSFEFYIVDRAGHESNHITTPPIIIYRK